MTREDFLSLTPGDQMDVGPLLPHLSKEPAMVVITEKTKRGVHTVYRGNLTYLGAVMAKVRLTMPKAGLKMERAD